MVKGGEGRDGGESVCNVFDIISNETHDNDRVTKKVLIWTIVNHGICD